MLPLEHVVVHVDSPAVPDGVPQSDRHHLLCGVGRQSKLQGLSGESVKLNYVTYTSTWNGSVKHWRVENVFTWKKHVWADGRPSAGRSTGRIWNRWGRSDGLAGSLQLTSSFKYQNQDLEVRWMEQIDWYMLWHLRNKHPCSGQRRKWGTGRGLPQSWPPRSPTASEPLDCWLRSLCGMDITWISFITYMNKKNDQ